MPDRQYDNRFVGGGLLHDRPRKAMGIFPPTVVPAGFDDRMVLLPNSSRFQSSLPRAFEESFHDQRPIVLLIPRAEHQRHMLLFTLLLQQHQDIGLLSEFI